MIEILCETTEMHTVSLDIIYSIHPNLCALEPAYRVLICNIKISVNKNICAPEIVIVKRDTLKLK